MFSIILVLPDGIVRFVNSIEIKINKKCFVNFKKQNPFASPKKKVFLSWSS